MSGRPVCNFFRRNCFLAFQAALGVWHHIVITYNGSHVVLYVDGQPADEDVLQGNDILVANRNILRIYC